MIPNSSADTESEASLFSEDQNLSHTDDLDFGSIVINPGSAAGAASDPVWEELFPNDQSIAYDPLRDFNLTGERPKVGVWCFALRHLELLRASQTITTLIPHSELSRSGARLTLQINPETVRVQLKGYTSFLEIELPPLAPIEGVNPSMPLLFDIDFEDFHRTVSALDGDIHLRIDLSSMRLHLACATFRRPVRIRQEGSGFRLIEMNVGSLDEQSLRKVRADVIARAARLLQPALRPDSPLEIEGIASFREASLIGGTSSWIADINHQYFEGLNFNLPVRLIAALSKLSVLGTELDLIETPHYAIFRCAGVALGLAKIPTEFPSPASLKSAALLTSCTVLRAELQRHAAILRASLAQDETTIELKVTQRRTLGRITFTTIGSDQHRSTSTIDDVRCTTEKPIKIYPSLVPLQAAADAFDSTNVCCKVLRSKAQTLVVIEDEDAESGLRMSTFIGTAAPKSLLRQA